MFRGRLWDSGFFRLAVLAVLIAVAAEVIVAISAADHGPRRTPAETAAARQAPLQRLYRTAARIRGAERRDPAVRRERARLEADQRPHFASGRPGLATRAGQRALIRSLERSITRDSQRRFAAGTLDARASDT